MEKFMKGAKGGERQLEEGSEEENERCPKLRSIQKMKHQQNESNTGSSFSIAKREREVGGEEAKC